MARSIVRWILKFVPQNSASRTALLTLIYVATVALCFWAAYQILSSARTRRYQRKADRITRISPI